MPVKNSPFVTLGWLPEKMLTTGCSFDALVRVVLNCGAQNDRACAISVS